MGIHAGSEDRTIQDEGGVADRDSQLDQSIGQGILDAVVFGVTMIGFLWALIIFCGAING